MTSQHREKDKQTMPCVYCGGFEHDDCSCKIDNSIDSDIVIPDHILEQYFRLKNQADEYINRYIRHYRAEQIAIFNKAQLEK